MRFRDSKSPVSFGPALFWTCPSCKELRQFHALWDATLYLTCMGCTYGVRVAEEEDPLLEQAMFLHRKLEARFLLPKTYLERIIALDARFIYDLRVVQEDWVCACGEESPISFLECWNCGEARPDVVIQDDPPGEGPRIPDQGGWLGS